MRQRHLSANTELLRFKRVTHCSARSTSGHRELGHTKRFTRVAIEVSERASKEMYTKREIVDVLNRP
jgi:hypothetical protein